MLIKLTYDNLCRVKQILEEFGNMSGLVCNVEKTMLLPIGDINPVDPRILDLGFSVVEKLTILGLKIDKNGVVADNYQGILSKIKNQIAVWRPFNLSLPGRINIAKTLLYSQINYLGCFLPMPDDMLSEYDSLIVNFVKGKLNIAKKRMYQTPENGGLGLFDLRNFLDAQKCAWVKRSRDLSEQWKVILFVSNHGNLFNVKEKNINRYEFPICHSICKSFENFTDMYVKADENFRDSYIFDSRIFTLGLESKEHINRTHFDNIFFLNNSYKLYKVKYNNFYDNQDNIVSIEEVRESTGLHLTELQIFRFRGVCTTAKLRYKKKEIVHQKTTSIETFFNRKKRGSSHIRKILEKVGISGLTKNINKFAENMDIVISGEQSKNLNSLWSKTYFSNQDRTFFFKLYNNILGYNNAVAHFVQGHSPYCSFCELARLPDQNRETPVHLFFECVLVYDFLETTLKTVTGNDNFVFSRREYFTAFERREASHVYNLTLTLVTKLITKYLWDCKVRHCLPAVGDCLDNIKEKIGLQLEMKSNMSKIVFKSGLPFFDRENFDNIGPP
jgi:hypothetical protein